MNIEKKKLVIATRGSKLALWQAEYVRSLLREKYPELLVELNVIKTSGDKITQVPLAQIGGKGLFVKEIEHALLDGSADLAVHSIKDLPGELSESLELGAFPERGDAADCFLSEKYRNIFELPQKAVIGTSSVRRRSQLRALRPDLSIETLRGNLDTRIRKLREGMFDGIVVAAAGLNRLGLGASFAYRLTPPEFLPGVGQGGLGVEMLSGNTEIQELLADIDHVPTRYTINAERSFLRRLQGSCQVPIGGIARIKGQNTLQLSGLVSDLEGNNIISSQGEDYPENALELGTRIAEDVLNKGAQRILEEIYRLQGH